MNINQWTEAGRCNIPRPHTDLDAQICERVLPTPIHSQDDVPYVLQDRPLHLLRRAKQYQV